MSDSMIPGTSPTPVLAEGVCPLAVQIIAAPMMFRPGASHYLAAAVNLVTAGVTEKAAMAKYSFRLNFRLPKQDDDPERHLDALFEAGCDDASPGVGRRGMIGLDFTREAACAEDAIASAIRDVTNAIPGSVLVEAGPDPFPERPQ